MCEGFTGLECKVTFIRLLPLIIILGIIGSAQGIELVSKKYPEIDIYIGDIDDELTAKSYIVPGLGDAGDLCFGDKIEI